MSEIEETANAKSSSPSSSSKGVKRISQLNSPSYGKPDEDTILKEEKITEEEWLQSSGSFILGPPIPLSLVGRVVTMAQKFVKYMQAYFVQRPKVISENYQKTRFRRRNIPTISLYDYTLRICNYVVALEPSMLLAVIAYAHTLDPHAEEVDADIDHNIHGPITTDRITLMPVDSSTVHRFVISSICLASKALGDHYYSNSFYAKVGGISTKELNCLELELAILLNWRLQCSLSVLVSIWNRLEAMD